MTPIPAAAQSDRVSHIRPPGSPPSRAKDGAPDPLAGLLAGLLPLGRPAVMAVLNVTPDSFSDGGHFFDPQRAIDHAKKLSLKITYKK